MEFLVDSINPKIANRIEWSILVSMRAKGIFIPFLVRNVFKFKHSKFTILVVSW
jgi:hypothetical protein